MNDESTPRDLVGDLPVRDLQERIAYTDRVPHARLMRRAQRVSLAYTHASARVLLEQSELYAEALWDHDLHGSSAELRDDALDQARIIAELFLSLQSEDIDVGKNAVAGLDPTVALLALHFIGASDLLLTSEEPVQRLLFTEKEIDHVLHHEVIEAWWQTVLPDMERLWYADDDDIDRKPGTPAPKVPITALAAGLRDAADRYRSLLQGHESSGLTDQLRAQALALAQEANLLMCEMWEDGIDFDEGDEDLAPTASNVVLHLIISSCVVLAAPQSDFERYAITAATLEEKLADPELQRWQAAVAELDGGS